MPESVDASCLLPEEFGPSRLRVALGQVAQPLTRKGSLRHPGAVARRGVRAYTDALGTRVPFFPSKITLRPKPKPRPATSVWPLGLR